MPGKDKLVCVGKGDRLCDYGYNCSPDETRTPCQRCGHEKHEIERRKKLLATVGLRKSGKTWRLFV